LKRVAKYNGSSKNEYRVPNPGLFDLVMRNIANDRLYESQNEPRPSASLAMRVAQFLNDTFVYARQAEIEPDASDIDVTWRNGEQRVKVVFSSGQPLRL